MAVLVMIFGRLFFPSSYSNILLRAPTGLRYLIVFSIILRRWMVIIWDSGRKLHCPTESEIRKVMRKELTRYSKKFKAPSRVFCYFQYRDRHFTNLNTKAKPHKLFPGDVQRYSVNEWLNTHVHCVYHIARPKWFSIKTAGFWQRIFWDNLLCSLPEGLT